MSNKILLLNAAIMTANGTFRLSNITLEDVKEMLTEENIMSAIGHNATADIMSELIGKTFLPIAFRLDRNLVRMR